MMRGDRTARRRGKDAATHSLSAILSGIGLLGTLLLGTLLLGTLLTGCGAPAAPQPPTLNLPLPVQDLSAARVGGAVHLVFTVPQKTIDKLPVRDEMTAQFCRSLETGPCQPAGTVSSLSAAKTVTYDDALPAGLLQGLPRLLTYRVTVLNHAGKAATPSAPAFAVAGAAPPPVAGFQATPRRSGIVLSWQAGDASFQPSEGSGAKGSDVRFQRTRIAGSAAPPPFGPGKGRTQEEPAEQNLRVQESSAVRSPVALDKTAHTGHSYQYTAQRVESVALGKLTLSAASEPSASLSVDYRDIFPPAVPTDLVSAVDTPGKAVDLSWTPDGDSGLAGYVIYRRTLPAGGTNTNDGTNAKGTPERMSPAGRPVSAPAWRDTTILAGQRYAYSVSAVDTSGNESARSSEVEDGLRASPLQP